MTDVTCSPYSDTEDTCEWWVDDQGDERDPRWFRSHNPFCPVHPEGRP